MSLHSLFAKLFKQKEVENQPVTYNIDTTKSNVDIIKQILSHKFDKSRIYSSYFTDKRKGGRRLKFYKIRPSESDIAELNEAFQQFGINATAKINILQPRLDRYNTTAFFSKDVLTIRLSN
jgi:hypothetical protein